jgi:hypothetical protein
LRSKMYIIEGSNILLRQVRRRAPHRIAHLLVCPGISKITRVFPSRDPRA